MNRRRFLLTSVASAAPTHVLSPPAAAGLEPKRGPNPPSASHARADQLQGLANELQNLSHVVEGYSRILLQKMDETDPLLRVPAALLATARQLIELTGHLRAMAGGIPPGTPVRH
jgi:hypothetical protein